MQPYSSLVSLLAVLYVLEPTLAIAIVRPQAYLSLDPSLAPGRRPLDTRMTGLRFFRRRAPAALVDDWNDVNDQKPDVAHIPKRTRSLITLHPISTEGNRGESHIIIGNHKHRRAFHGSMLRTRRSSTHGSDVTSFGIQGVAGTIDIMSPTADSPAGERIASLSVSTESSEQNQFVLNASGVNASTVYLVVKSDVPTKEGSLTVALQVPVFDQAKASYVGYCATFDTTQASPLTAVECVNNDQDVTDHSSQLFSYNSTSGVIKPLWLTSAPLPDVGTPASAKEEDNATDQQELPEESDPTNPTSDSSTAPQPQSVSLVFTPDLDSSTPVVNSSVEGGDGSNASDPSSSMSSTSSQSQTVSGMAMNTYAPSPTPTISLETAEAVSSSTGSPTMCTDSAMMQMPSQSVVAGDSMQPPHNDEVSPMMDEPSSSMTAETTSTSTVSSTESALPTETTATRRRDIVDDNEPEADNDEDQDTDPNETSDIGNSNDEAKREVDTAYLWKFSSAPVVGDDGDFVR